MIRKIPELLAPAGDWTALHAALQNGCDAVYFGVEALNMRAMAANFCRDDLPAVKKLCREYGARNYLTLNVVVYDQELDEAEELIRQARGQVDAIICWDPAVISLCREYSVPFHISTQASVSNARSAAYYRDLGAQRINLARECSLAEIKHIREAAGVPVEAFVHGAMCVSVSGRCFLSQFADGKSANRGGCLQHCRREYHLTDPSNPEIELDLGEHYVMSAKDMCALPFLDKLMAAGIDAFKLEGRGKSPHYVATVTRCYRRAIDAAAAGELTASLKDELVTELEKVFNRGFCNGFYFGRPIGEFTDTAGSKTRQEKVFVGFVTNYFKQPQVAEIEVRDQTFSERDTLLIEGGATGAVTITVEEVRQDEKRVEKPKRGIVTVPCPIRVRENNKVYRLRDL
ncbi:MAG: peptidase U32 family protein [Lentisphaeria bacterium]